MSLDNTKKLEIVLASCNNNSSYYKFIPYQIYVWAKFGIKFICIFVGEKIPEELKDFKDHIILWDRNLDLNHVLITFSSNSNKNSFILE
jgi:hypothetical protein